VRLAGPERLRLLFERLEEALEDRRLHVDALGLEADLAGIVEDGARGLVDRALEVAIREDERGILAAELKGDRTDAVGRRLHDGGAGRGLAGEGDGVDAGMPRQELARRARPEAVDDVVDALGHARGVHDLAQERRRRRRLLGGLHHHGIAAGERGRHLPGHQEERQVPGADHRDDAAGRADRVVDRGAAARKLRLEGLGGGVLGDLRENREVRAAAGDVEVRGDRMRLSRIGDLGLEEILEALGDARSDRAEDLSAVVGAHLAPGPLERGTRGLDRGVDVGGARLVHLRDELSRHRRAVLEATS